MEVVWAYSMVLNTVLYRSAATAICSGWSLPSIWLNGLWISFSAMGRNARELRNTALCDLKRSTSSVFSPSACR
ncbi:hypothetical protein D3C85_1467920 [compost metagenome]